MQRFLGILFFSFLTLQLPAQAGIFPTCKACCKQFAAHISPNYRVELLLEQYDQQRNEVAEWKNLLSFAADLGVQLQGMDYLAPDQVATRYAGAIYTKFQNLNLGPLQYVENFVRNHTSYATIFAQIKDDVIAQDVELKWTAGGVSYRHIQEIFIDIQTKMSSPHPELAVLTGMVHELAHEVIYVNPKPGESRDAFKKKWLPILEEDEIKSTRATAAFALALEQIGDVQAEAITVGASNVFLDLLRRPFFSSSLQRKAEKLVIRRVFDGKYVKEWDLHLDLRWQQPPPPQQ